MNVLLFGATGMVGPLTGLLSTMQAVVARTALANRARS